ncbi:MAG TPA: phosphatidate cytidylyltransferase, partial [Balneolaceae bacterium]|nr:phosphatidate cytidylyltransferase [Balneolaceae bacterium]
ESAGFKIDRYFPYTITLWILLTPYLQHPYVIGLAIFLLFIGLNVFKPGDRGVKELFSTFFCGIYVSAGFLTLLLTRGFGDSDAGFLLTITLLLMVWGNDVFAYFGGKTFGRNLLAPRVSPNKTWEGFFFGVLGALVGLAIAMYLVPGNYPASFLEMLPAVLMVSIFGPIGDLTESRIKRAAKIKDASDILPGHGGFFDRFDALILASPAFFFYLYLMNILGYVSF